MYVVEKAISRQQLTLSEWFKPRTATSKSATVWIRAGESSTKRQQTPEQGQIHATVRSYVGRDRKEDVIVEGVAVRHLPGLKRS